MSAPGTRAYSRRQSWQTASPCWHRPSRSHCRALVRHSAATRLLIFGPVPMPCTKLWWVRHSELRTNPVREIAKIPRGRRSKPRALTVEQERLVTSKVHDDPIARVDQEDVADLVEFMDGTGMRIGEACGVRAEVIDLDPATGTAVIEVNATVVRLKGRGSVLQPRTKSEAGWRVIAVPPNVVAICRRRLAMTWPDNRDGLLFPSKAGGPRNTSNANRDMKAALVRIDPGLDWVTSHTFRKTAVTRLDDAGLTAREIADHVGHSNPSMTQNSYMGRGVASAKAATLLGDGASGSTEGDR
jgi:integrase